MEKSPLRDRKGEEGMRNLTLVELETTFFILNSGNQKAIDGYILLCGGCPEQGFINDFVRPTGIRQWVCKYGHSHDI